MMLRVRPAQFTTTRVAGSLTSSFTRWYELGPGAVGGARDAHPAVLVGRAGVEHHQVVGRSRRAFSSAAGRCGVP